jgi:hypothetical protein
MSTTSKTSAADSVRDKTVQKKPFFAMCLFFQVNSAVEFLKCLPISSNTSLHEKEAFLRLKGLTPKEISAALEKSG